MKTLSSLTTRRLYLLLFLLLFILVLVIIFSVTAVRFETMGTDYRAALNKVNGVITELHHIRLMPPEQRSFDRLEERLDALSETPAITRGRAEPTDDLHGLVAKLKEGSISFDQAVDVVGSVARNLSTRFYQNRKWLISIAALDIILNLAAIVILLVVTLSLRSATHYFYGQIGRGLESMQQVLNYEQDRLELIPPKWEEGRRLNEAVRRFTEQIDQDRTLREMELQTNIEALLPMVKELIGDKIPCDRISVAFLDTQGIVIAEAAISSMEKVVLEPGFTEHINSTTLARVIAQKEPRIINDLEAHYKTVHASISTGKILEEGIRASITVPLFFETRCVGFFFISSRLKDAYRKNHAYHAKRIAYTIKQNLYYTFVLQQVVAESATAFVKLTEKKDNETSLHILRMARYSYLIARQILNSGTYSISPRFIREILWFAPLHDIGKIGIPDSILLKPGPLTPAERNIMESHVTIGEEVIWSMDRGLRKTMEHSLLRTAIDIIKSHHEKWDGSGYPDGLRGESIPLAGRITAIADVFDALTSRRSYKEPFSVEKSLGIIRNGKGSHFDPVVVEAFETTLPEILAFYETHKEV
ncbi:HD-GYP domain-containing protein [Sediminispirochaeta smaragdinae]|uniref:Metal dependent phosphohydrolase n=1 Tax=Sediminispirochaeta smaragdinae (strain DSM 11293 / JCM 15392 / SEBR 4228) TaxID=573413 RepID=E1R522_SEDSS|nr:HD domain-containing phosphohydrolase [Sediminispirochaeta smaragdinae]ADK80557.1 metal dependent phosphohydrolase [Sediminispirochaeta smaragdinae DSM 11293]